MKILKTLSILVLSSAILGGCSKGPLAIYKRDIQQGNILTQDMVAKLRTNLSKSQVTKILGSPTLISNYHQDQWHYFYSFKSGDGKINKKKDLSLYFRGDNLKAYKGDWNISKLNRK